MPGTAKELIDQANQRIWGTLSSAQLKLVGQLSTLERIIELDNLYDAQKSAADAIIKNLNVLVAKYGNLKTKEERDVIDEQIKQAEAELEKIYKDNPSIRISKGKIRDKKYNGKRWGKKSTKYELEYISKDKDGKDVINRMKPGLGPINKKFPWRLKHPRTKNPRGEGYIMMNKEIAQDMINRMKEEQGDRFSVIRDATDKLFEEYSNELKRNYEAGLIDEATYNELKNLKYNPRKFVDYVIFAERDIIRQRKSGMSDKNFKAR